jgi:hypothetical protein
LNKILNSQRSPNYKTVLEYDPSTEQENDKINYADVLKNSINRKEKKTRTIPFETIPNKYKYELYTNEKDKEKNRIIRRNPSNRNKYIFLSFFNS